MENDDLSAYHCDDDDDDDENDESLDNGNNDY